MDNLEKLVTLGTQDAGWRQTKQKTQHRKLKRRTTNERLHQKQGNPGAREEQAVPASYKTPTMVLIL